MTTSPNMNSWKLFCPCKNVLANHKDALGPSSIVPYELYTLVLLPKIYEMSTTAKDMTCNNTKQEEKKKKERKEGKRSKYEPENKLPWKMEEKY